MAKLIRCPSCGDNVELPGGAVGEQMLRCDGCGRAIKVVLRAPGDAPRAPRPAAAPSVSDGPAACAVCGGTFEKHDLLDDRGRPVCAMCLRKLKGPAAVATAPGWGAVAGEPVGRARSRFRLPIDVSAPQLWMGAGALLVLVLAQTYLWLNPRPAGSQVRAWESDPILRAPTVPAAPAVRDVPPQAGATWEDQNAPAIRALMAEADRLRFSSTPEDRRAAQEAYARVVEMARGRRISDPALEQLVSTAAMRDESLRNELRYLDRPPQPQPQATNAPRQRDVPARQPAPEPEPQPGARGTEPPAADVEADPAMELGAEPVAADAPVEQGYVPDPRAPDILHKGLTALAEQRWEDAALDFRAVLSLRRRADDPAHIQAQDGLAAAYIGMGRFSTAATPITRAHRSAGANVTRSILVNKTLVDLKLGRNTELDDDAVALRDALSRDLNAGGADASLDEHALNVYGTLLAELETRPAITADELRPFWQAYDRYEEQLEAQRPGERRWGTTWQPASTVEALELARRFAAPRAAQLRDEISRAIRQRESASLANRSTAAIDRTIDEKQQELNELTRTLPQPEWLTTLTPAIPDPAVTRGR